MLSGAYCLLHDLELRSRGRLPHAASDSTAEQRRQCSTAMSMRTKSLLAAGLLASGVGSLLLTNASPMSWALASLSMWSTFVLASSKDGLRQSWLHALWAYLSAAAFLIYLHKDPSFQVRTTARQASSALPAMHCQHEKPS
jgi:hypothetical protein